MGLIRKPADYTRRGGKIHKAVALDEELQAPETQVGDPAYVNDLASAKRAAHANGKANTNGSAQVDSTAYHYPQSAMAACSDTASAHGYDQEPEVLEPIAIIGMSLKFPQAVNTDSFWTMLVNQHCASIEFPKDRLNIDAFYDSNPKKLNRISTRAGHFLEEDVRAFDAPFFSIPPLEAGTMDPQHRGLMEATYHALENAGLALKAVAGSNTSVHVGCFTSDFVTMNWRDSQQIPKYSATGSAASILSNRLSWFYDLRGPSMTVDTACSSGMIALDLACNGLRSGSSNIAIVASANLICSPELNIAMSNMNFLSPEGRCHSFDYRANGYARGEGFGVLILKPVSQALKDGDTVRALIRSVGTNQDGHTYGGITQPSKDLQSQLIRETYRKAGLNMGVTRFFEAHGTGTAIGDPIEARAVGECFKLHRSSTEPLYIGAVKSNIGHLEGASGLASIIKTVLVLEHGLIPPNTNFECLNPNIDAEFLNLEFPLSCIPWPSKGVRRASVNSFGFGGSNAHVILDDAHHYLQSRKLPGNHCTALQSAVPITIPEVPSNGLTVDTNGIDYETRHPTLLTFSAADEGGISRLMEAYRQFFDNPDLAVTPKFLQDLAFTLNTRRTSLPWKTFAVVYPLKLTGLREMIVKPVKAASNLRLGFVFTGQGAQWFAMGRELLSASIFMDSIRLSQVYLNDLGSHWLLIDELMKSENSSRVAEPQISQSLTTAIQIALIDLFEWFGVTPLVVVGHSSGEISAAYCAGHLSQESAIKVAYYRGILVSRLANSNLTKSAMVSVGLSQREAANQFKELGDLQKQDFDASLVSVSCINSPTNVTVSGPEQQMGLLISHLHKQEIFARKLKVNVAYHSPQMHSIASEYLKVLGQLEKGPKRKNIRMMSSVICEIVSEEEVCTGRYWVQNLVSPVNFLEAMRLCCFRPRVDSIIKKLDRSHYNEIVSHFWVEIGPHSALQGPIRDILKSVQRNNDVDYHSALVRNKSALATVLETAGRLWCRNFDIDMGRVAMLTSTTAYLSKILPNLPQYPFNHSTVCWEESQANKAFRFRKHANHSLLGAPVVDWSPLEAKWKFIIRAEELPWIKDHKINGSILYPAAGMLTMAIEASKLLAEDRSPVGFEIRDAEFSAPVLLTMAPEGVETFITLSPISGSSTEHHFQIIVQKSEKDWDKVCHGFVRADYGRVISEVDGGKEAEKAAIQLKHLHAQALASCSHSVKPVEMYRQLKDIGLEYGPSFQPLDKIGYNDSGEAIAAVLPFTWCEGYHHESEFTQRTTIHPATFDGCFQLSFVALSKGGDVPLRTMVPTRVGRAWVSSLGAGNSVLELQTAHCQAETISQRLVQCDISVLTVSSQQSRVQVQGLELTAISGSQDTVQRLQKPKYLCYHMDWRVDLDTLDTDQIYSYCEKARNPNPDPIAWFRDFETLAACFGAQALQELKRLGRKPSQSSERYASWLQIQLDSDSAEGPAERVQARRDLLYDQKYLSVLCDRMSKNSKRGELYAKVGLHLTKVLLGDLNPLKLLFSDEQLLTDFYEEINTSSTAFDAVLSYLDAAIQKDPGMKFLEIGAGTGATTATIIKTIGTPGNAPRYREYVFTDISLSFFNKARERFNMQKQLSYRILNIEQDPIAQGYVAGEYDVIIAAMVLHATRNLETTLRNVRRLLKPGGKLILMELTAPNRTWTGFVFGLLPGWWLSSESYRQLSPCITEQDWNDVLCRSGFSGTDLVFKDYQAEECRGWSVMVSTASFEITTLPQVPRVTVILDTQLSSQRAIAEELGRQLEAQGGSIDMCRLSEAGFLKDINARHFVLIRDLESPMLRNLDPESFSALQTLLVCAGSFIWITRGGGKSPSSPDYSMVDGLCRVSRHENQSVPLVKLALDTTKEALSVQDIAQIVKIFNLTASGVKSGVFEPQYSEMEGLLHINRIVEADYINDHIFARTAHPVCMKEFGTGPSLKLNVRTPGLLDSMEFVEDELVNESLAPHEVLIEIHAIGLNFKDCLTVLGRIDSDVLGSDCAGIVARVGEECQEFQQGDRVFACVLNSYRTFARANSSQVIKMPDAMTFAEGASIPTAFLTAYYSFHEVARLRKHESVLIHAASGGTGQAAIQIALDIGAEVFATVGSLSKKQLLMEIYKIPEDHIFYSRDTSFADGVRRMTQGRGVDVVLNSLSGNGLVASWECIAPFGRFIEIGRRDIDARGSLPMYYFIRNASFSGVDLTSILQRGLLGGKMLKQIVLRIESGTAKPPHPLHVYPLAEIKQAFRFLQSGKSSGKIVLEVTKHALVPTVLGSKSNFSFDANSTYVVAGGLGGIGRSICRWLVDRGAKNLLLLSRSGSVGNQKAQALLEDLRNKGVVTDCSTCDIGNMQSLKNVLRRCSETMPPIKGCFQASMVLRDATFAKMSFSDWVQSTHPKVQGSWNLHVALPVGMDFFIMLSSVCGVFGNGGQSNYAAGNTFQDALAEYRRSSGEKAVALDLGIMLSEGFVAENQHVMDRLKRVGVFLPIHQNELFAIFDYYCNPSSGPAKTFKSQVITGLEIPNNMLAQGAEIPVAMRQPLFRHMHQIDASGAGSSNAASKPALDTKVMVMQAESSAAAVAVVAEALKMKLSQIMGIPHADIDLQHRVESYGVDSLVAVELRNWLAKELSADIAVFEILGGATLVGVSQTVVRKSSLSKPSWDGK